MGMRQALRTALNVGFWIVAALYTVAVFASIVVIVTAAVDR
jgi:hypothetical protein